MEKEGHYDLAKEIYEVRICSNGHRDRYTVMKEFLKKQIPNREANQTVNILGQDI